MLFITKTQLKIFAQFRFSFEIVCKVVRSSPILFPLATMRSSTKFKSTVRYFIIRSVFYRHNFKLLFRFSQFQGHAITDLSVHKDFRNRRGKRYFSFRNIGLIYAHDLIVLVCGIGIHLKVSDC